MDLKSWILGALIGSALTLAITGSILNEKTAKFAETILECESEKLKLILNGVD